MYLTRDLEIVGYAVVAVVWEYIVLSEFFWQSCPSLRDSFKLKEFADDNFKFDKNGRKLSKWVENIVGKGEIARYEQFLLFPQCFQKACLPGASKGVIVWEWVKQIQCYLRKKA